jgi:hypothetical protein
MTAFCCSAAAAAAALEVSQAKAILLGYLSFLFEILHSRGQPNPNNIPSYSTPS